MISTAWPRSPGLLRRRLVLATIAHGAVVGIIGSILQAALGLGDWYPVRALGIFAALGGVVITAAPCHHPFRHFGAANQVTLFRAAMVALIGALASERPDPATALVAAIASLVITASDGVDGWLARRTRMASAFGARFDMETDALLVLALSVLVWQYDKAGGWIILAGALRYLFLALGAFAPRLRAPLPPSVRRQAVCVLQIAGLSIVLLPVVMRPLSEYLAATLLIALAYSFLVDTLWLWRR